MTGRSVSCKVSAAIGVLAQKCVRLLLKLPDVMNVILVLLHERTLDGLVRLSEIFLEFIGRGELSK